MKPIRIIPNFSVKNNQVATDRLKRWYDENGFKVIGEDDVSITVVLNR